MKKGKIDPERIKEAKYWEDFDLKAMQFGLPFWVDMQNGQYLKTPKRYLWSDPETDKILYGREKRLLINSVPKNSKVLEVGCGSGWLCLELTRRGHKVVGIDIAQKRIEIAREIARKNNVEIDYRVCALADLDQTERFDVVVLAGTLHHFPNIEEELERINVKLVDKGIFIILENRSNIFRNMANLFRKVALKKTEEHQSPFEDVASCKLESEVKRVFLVNREFRFLAFTKVMAEATDLAINVLGIKFRPWLLYPVLRLLKWIDDVLCYLGLIRGEVVFMHCEKK